MVHCCHAACKFKYDWQLNEPAVQHSLVCCCQQRRLLLQVQLVSERQLSARLVVQLTLPSTSVLSCHQMLLRLAAASHLRDAAVVLLWLCDLQRIICQVVQHHHTPHTVVLNV